MRQFFLLLTITSLSVTAKAQIKTPIAIHRVLLNVRGQVVTNYNGTMLPYKLARVDLYYSTGGQWTKVQSAITDSYGYYYFKGVQPSFTLQVNNSKNFNITLPKPDLGNTYQDIPPLVMVAERQIKRY